MANKFLIDNLDVASIPLASSDKFIVEDNERSTKKLSAYDMYRDILSNHLFFNAGRSGQYGDNVLSVMYADGPAAEKTLLATANLQDGILSGATFDRNTSILSLWFNTSTPENSVITVDLSSLIDTYYAGYGISIDDRNFINVDIGQLQNDFLAISGGGLTGDLSIDSQNNLFANFSNIYDIATDQSLSSILDNAGQKLTDEQMSALNAMVYDRQTIIDFGDNDISTFNWVGEISENDMKRIGILSGANENHVWLKQPRHVKIGSAISCAGFYLFGNCSSLTSIALPNTLYEFGFKAFKDCIGLKDIVIPNSITNFNSNDVFFGCTQLTGVSLGTSLSSLYSGTFRNCSSLSNIIIPANIQYVSGSVFSGCSSLTRIIVEGKNQAEAEAMLSVASVPANCKIVTYIKDDVIDQLSAQILELSNMIVNS